MTDDTASPRARLVETHTAYVLLLGDTVVKWKKHLDLGFADFRDVRRREEVSHAEVTLNRRLAPDVYRGVAQVTGPHGELWEHLVVMDRLPDDRRLSTLVEQGAELSAPLQQLAQRLADLHAACGPSPRAAAVASAEQVQRLWQVGLDALSLVPADVVDPALVARARELVDRYVAGRAALFEQRIEQGLVRDGHGDLLADDVFCLPGGPQVLDCLEFDDDLRHGDVLSDVASLLADLERLGAGQAAAGFLDHYQRLSGERHPRTLQHLYVAYRAQVRAKVAGVRADQLPDSTRRHEQHRLSRQLSGVMLQHLERTTVRLLLVGGLPASGKSTIARAVADREDAVLLSSDLVRRELLGRPVGPRAEPDAPAAERYSGDAVDRVYAEMLGRARRALTLGRSVVLDASWTSKRHREQAERLAGETSSELVALECRVDHETAAVRLSGRQPQHVSEATPTVRRWMAERADPWPEAVVLDTSGSVAETVRRALSVLQRPGPGP